MIKPKPKRSRKGSKADLRVRTYHSWASMLERCYNDTHVSYIEYGGRGITVCDRWNPKSSLFATVQQGLRRRFAYQNFVADVGIKPSWRHTLDRRDPQQHYTPDNCKWATPKEQGVNKRDTHFVRHPSTGERIAAATLADALGISYQQLRVRMMRNKTWYELFEAEIVTDRILKPGEKP